MRVALAAVTATPSPVEKTVTVQMTMPQMQTWELEEIHRTTQVKEYVTLTVPATVRITHTVTMGWGT